MENGSFERITVIGGGTIGASWAVLFEAYGLSVTLYDPDPGAADFFRGLREQSKKLRGDILPADARETVRFTQDIKDAAREAQFIQECGPDDIGVKREIYAALDAAAPKSTIIATSTSWLQVTDIQKGLEGAARCIAGHPFNPPHLIPLVEVVGGEQTDPANLDIATAFYEQVGKRVIRLRKEVMGHIVNRLQAALVQEAFYLIKEGVADTKDIDDGISYGPGLRWGARGPVHNFHLAARDGGIGAYMEGLGPGLERMFENLGSVEKIDAGLLQLLVDGVAADTKGKSVKELASERDDILLPLIKARLDQDKALGD